MGRTLPGRVHCSAWWATDARHCHQCGLRSFGVEPCDEEFGRSRSAMTISGPNPESPDAPGVEKGMPRFEVFVFRAMNKHDGAHHLAKPWDDLEFDDVHEHIVDSQLAG